MQFHIASPLPEAPPKRDRVNTAFLDVDSVDMEVHRGCLVGNTAWRKALSERHVLGHFGTKFLGPFPKMGQNILAALGGVLYKMG
jgi:hypothetical protein